MTISLFDYGIFTDGGIGFGLGGDAKRISASRPPPSAPIPSEAFGNASHFLDATPLRPLAVDFRSCSSTGAPCCKGSRPSMPQSPIRFPNTAPRTSPASALGASLAAPRAEHSLPHG